MASTGDFLLICADGRFIAVPGGVFFHDGPMSERVDPAALVAAMQAPRVDGAITVFVREQTRSKIEAFAQVRRAIDDIPAQIRERFVLGTFPGERADQDAWLRLTDAFGLPKHATYQPGLTPSPRVVPLDTTGLETTDNPATVRILSRPQAAARETLRSALDGATPSWARLEQLVGHATDLRDKLRVPLRLNGDERPGAAYALAAGIALYGVPDGTDPDVLRRSVRPVDADQVLRAWGGRTSPTDARDLVTALVAMPGAGALIRVDASGADRPGLGWLVSRPDGLAWIDPGLDNGAAVRMMPAADAVALLGTLPGRGPASPRVDALLVDAQGRPLPADPGTAPSTPGISRVNTADTTLTTPDLSPVPGVAGDPVTEPRPAGGDVRGLGPAAEALRHAGISFTADPVARPDLTDTAQREAALGRLLRWTAAVEVPGDPAALPPEDCVARAWGAFIAVHRRSGNTATDADLVETRTAEALATRLGGRLTRLTDPGVLWGHLTGRPGTMALVRTPPREDGISHVFWVMSTEAGRLIWVDSQRAGVSGRPAAIGARDEHAAWMRAIGTDVLLIDERGGAVDLSAGLPPVPNPADRPIENSAAGMHRLSERIRARLGTGSGDVYCAAAVSLARDELYGRLGITLTPQDGRARDDLTAQDGLWAGWGAPGSWPQVSGWAEIGEMLGEKPGRTAFVLSGRPGAIGHAFLVRNTADGLLVVDPSAPAESGRVRPFAGLTTSGAVDLRIRIFDADGTGVSVAAAPPESARPAATALAMIDRAERRYQGSGVEDEETVMLFFDDDVDISELDGAVLASGPDGEYRIEGDSKAFYRGPDDRYYINEAQAIADGGSGDRVDGVIIERISGIMRSHPHEVNRKTPDAVFDAFARMASKTARLPGIDGAGPVTTLRDYLSGTGLDLTLTELGEQTRVGRPPVGEAPGSHYHFTHGVPLSGMRTFLEHVRDNTWRDQEHGYLTRDYLTDGLAFGDRLAAQFLDEMPALQAMLVTVGYTGRMASGPELENIATLIAGYAALFYDSFAGVATWPASEYGLNKVHMAALARPDAFADILDRLPVEATDFFVEQWEEIWDALEAGIRARIPDYDALYRTKHRLGGWAPVDFDTILTDGDVYTLRDYARSAFVPNAPRVTQSDAIGFTTPAPLDLAGGALLIEHIPVEVRSYVARRMNARQAQRANEELSRRANQAYEAELALRPEQRAAGSRAWLTPRTDRGLRWVSTAEIVPDWARQLGERAAGLGRLLVVIDAHGPQIAERLAEQLDNEPGLARNALFVAAGADLELNDLRRRHALNIIYPVQVQQPGTARTYPHWRLVTFDNQVHHLGIGDLAPEAVTTALNTVDTAAYAGLGPLPGGTADALVDPARGGRRSGALPAVSIRAPQDHAPRDYAPRDQVAELRGHADAATERTRAVLDRFPNSDAAELVGIAMRQLDAAERETPDADGVQNLRLLFDRAATEIIRLDPGARTVLAPLWSGRQRPARPVPAPRALGPWTAGDLAATTAGLGRPVLSVDLSGTTPQVIDDLEHALREHGWWGEAPIVISTLGTGSTDASFTALRERFRPVVIRQAVTDGFTVVWRLHDQDGTVVEEATALTTSLFRAAAGLRAAPHGTALPPVLAGLLTAGPDSARHHREHERQLDDPGVREALDTLIATAPDGERLAGYRAALSLPADAAARPVPAVTSTLDVEPAYTGGPVPASFAYDFLAQTGGRRERFAMDGLLFQMVLAGRLDADQALALLRAGVRNPVDRAAVQVFEAVFALLALPDEVVAADPHTHPALTAILAKVGAVARTARADGTPPPDCVDPIDRTAFVGRLDAVRDTLRADGRSARASLVETVTYVLANC